MARTLKAALLGAVLLGLFASVDGLIIGYLLSKDSHAALVWAGYFTLGGSILGGVVGACLSRIVLRPPGENER